MDKVELMAMELEALRNLAVDLGVEVAADAEQEFIADSIVAALTGQPMPVVDLFEEKPVPVEISTLGAIEPLQGVAAEPIVADLAVEPVIATNQPKPTAVQTFNPEAQFKNGDQWPTVAEARAALASHIMRGLTIVKMTEDYWHFRVSNREAAGNLKMPLKQLILQANILLRPTAKPTEGLDFDEIIKAKLPKKG